MDEVPVQFFQSVIAIELAITGALLFQIRYFAPHRESDHQEDDLPDPRLRLLVAVILGATMFGSLEAIAHERGETAATGVLVGLSLSLLPILLRVLPPLGKEAGIREWRSEVAITVLGLVVYIALTAGAVYLVNA